MHTANRGRDFGSKVIAVIDHVDHATKKINGRLKDNGVISITVIDVPPTFVWPRPGEYWYVRKENYHWRLETKMDLRNDFKIEDLLPGESRISSTKLRNENGDYFVLSNYGSFYDTTASVTATTTPKVLTYNSKDISNGISIANNSKITIANSGIYNIQFSTQLQNTDTSLQDIEIWLRKNGSNVSNSNTLLNVPIKHGAANPGHTIAAWNFLVNASANDYYEIAYAIPSTNTAGAVKIITYASTTSGPQIPATILTVHRVG